MLRLLSYLIALPLAVVLIALAVANRAPVTLSLDPFSPEAPAMTVTTPLFMALFAALVLGIVIGGGASWLAQGKWRRVARERRFEVAKWRHEADRYRERSEATAAGPALPAPDARRNAA